MQNHWEFLGTSYESSKVPSWLIEISNPTGIIYGKNFVYKIMIDLGSYQGNSHYHYYRRLKRGKHFIKNYDHIDNKYK